MTDASNFTSLAEISNLEIDEAMEYNPAEFVNAEMEQEKENLVSANNEAVESELGQQAENLSIEREYQAPKFVEEEIRIEF